VILRNTVRPGCGSSAASQTSRAPKAPDLEDWALRPRIRGGGKGTILTGKPPAVSSETTSEASGWPLRRELFGLELVAGGDGTRLLRVLASEFPEGPAGPRLLSGQLIIELSHSRRPPEPPRSLLPGARLAGFLQQQEHLWLRTECGAELYGDARKGVGSIFVLPAACGRLSGQIGSGSGMLVSHLLRGRGLYTVHAAAVSASNGVLLICGMSGSGKSTTAAILASESDCSLLADDRVMLADRGGELIVFPYPRPSSLRPPMAGGIPDAVVQAATAPCRPAALLFPCVRPDSRTHVQRLDPMSALRAVLQASVVRSPWIDEHFRLVSRLVRETPSYALTVGSDWGRLTGAVRSVLAPLASAA
jgi:hypothetical protein